jgi:hypothetical protein
MQAKFHSRAQNGAHNTRNLWTSSTWRSSAPHFAEIANKQEIIDPNALTPFRTVRLSLRLCSRNTRFLGFL